MKMTTLLLWRIIDGSVMEVARRGISERRDSARVVGTERGSNFR